MTFDTATRDKLIFDDLFQNSGVVPSSEQKAVAGKASARKAGFAIFGLVQCDEFK